MEYWISIKGQKQGPLREWDLRAMIEDKSLTEEDLIWHSALPKWEKLADYTAFQSYFRQPEIQTVGETPLPEDEIAAVKKELQAKIEEVTGKPVPSDAVIRVEKVTSHHWVRRGFAKLFDYTLYSVTFFIIANLCGLQYGANPELSWVQLILLIPFFVLEAFMLYQLGTTPGKWVLGLRVNPLPGLPPLTFNRAFFRSAASWFFGLAMGVFPFCIVAVIMSYFTTKARGLSTWDAIGRCRVQPHRALNSLSIIGYIVLTITIMMASGVFITSHSPTRVTMGTLMMEQFKDYPGMQDQIRQVYKLPAAEPTPEEAEGGAGDGADL